MRIPSKLAAVIVLTSAVAAGCGSSDDELLVFAASSLTDAFTEIAEEFEQQNPTIDVQFSFAGSSTLREQILEGAPADVFAAASPGTMEPVVAADPVLAADTFARNDMVIAVPVGNPGAVVRLDDLSDPGLLVGLCATAVPCGALARQVLANAGVVPSIDTEEPNVRALLGKVEAGELDVALVYRTEAQTAVGRVEAIDIPANVNAFTSYPVVALKPGKADAFVAFVLSERGRAILAARGFAGP